MVFGWVLGPLTMHQLVAARIIFLTVVLLIMRYSCNVRNVDVNRLLETPAGPLFVCCVQCTIKEVASNPRIVLQRPATSERVFLIDHRPHSEDRPGSLSCTYMQSVGSFRKSLRSGVRPVRQVVPCALSLDHGPPDISSGSQHLIRPY